MAYALLIVQFMAIYMLLTGMFLKQLCIMCQPSVMTEEGWRSGWLTVMCLQQLCVMDHTCVITWETGGGAVQGAKVKNKH